MLFCGNSGGKSSGGLTRSTKCALSASSILKEIILLGTVFRTTWSLCRDERYEFLVAAEQHCLSWKTFSECHSNAVVEFDSIFPRCQSEGRQARGTSENPTSSRVLPQGYRVHCPFLHCSVSPVVLLVWCFKITKPCVFLSNFLLIPFFLLFCHLRGRGHPFYTLLISSSRKWISQLISLMIERFERLDEELAWHTKLCNEGRLQYAPA